MSADSEVDKNILDQQSEQSEQEENDGETHVTTNEAPTTWEDLVCFI